MRVRGTSLALACAVLSAAPSVSYAHPISAEDMTAIVMPGVSSLTTIRSYLRFSNAGPTPATASVELRDSATGEGLYEWTTPSIPPAGTLEVPVTQIMNEGDPIHSIRPPAAMVAEVEASFIGHVQHVMLSSAVGALYNASSCGMVLMADPLSLPYVSGPGRSDVAGQIRVLNATISPVTVKLTLTDNNGRASVWTSPSIAPFGMVARGVVDIGVAANPPIDPQATSLTVASNPEPMGVSLSYTEGLVGAPVQADFSAACMLSSPESSGMPGMPGMTPMPTPSAATPSIVDPSMMCTMMGMGGMDDMGMGGMGMGCPTMSARVPTPP